jgi:hypothetical protein
MKQPTLEELKDRTTVAGVAINHADQLRIDVIRAEGAPAHIDLRIYRRRSSGIFVAQDKSIVFSAELLDPLQQALRETREHLRGR